ncbi:MAG: PQQ-dependent sugar dehydrogenase [Verrucomicrobiae bacterium]|nr:PQQ-dependent sugar dehydrogenase [Verrucomicrobiae bacterium]
MPAFPNLTFLNPMGLLPVPGTSNLAVYEREGRIYQFPNDSQTASKTLVLDISRQCQGWDDSGLMGIAYHPGFETNRFLFVYYTWVAPGTVRGSATARPPTATPNRDRLERYTLDASGVAIPGSVQILMDQRAETVWHNGGGMFFHPQDGFLYLTNGDDAIGANAQRINRSLHSGVLRIDVDQRGGDISHPIPRQPQPSGSVTSHYFIPNDNPFVGLPGVLEEFFAVGLRSPHRMTLDPPTGRIFIGDVGGSSREELNIIEPTDPFGLNFQWDRIEGLGGDLNPPFIGVNHRPALDYPRSDGAAIIGGYVYRGQEFAAELGGRYVFGDNIANVIWVLDETTSPVRKVLLCSMPRGPGPNAGNDYVGLSGFGHDHENEIYMCQLSSTAGRIFKLRRGGPAPRQLPNLLSATGAFTDLATLTPSPGLVHYEPASPLWSDGASKERWMGIPDGTRIGFAPHGEWTFPAGAVWVKHFDLPVHETNPAIRRRLETRLLVRDTNGHVYGASYRWRPDQSDAEIVHGGLTEEIPITGAQQMGDLTSQDIGGPVAGSTMRPGDVWELTAGGADIWGATDQFRFAHQTREGDFDVRVRIHSVTPTDLHTKAGLMVRDSLNPNARHLMALVFPSNASRNNNDGGYEFQFRDTPGGQAAAIYPPRPNPRVRYPDSWLRLKRAGNVWTAYSSDDGRDWRPIATKTLTLPDTVYFGLALTAHTTSGARATARFDFRERYTQPWFFPGRDDCLRCHTVASGGVLGVSTRQSNREHLFLESGVRDNQLRAWNHAGYFDPALTESSIPGMPALVPLTDDGSPLERRVRSYLDSNCSHCHRPGGPAGQSQWDARIETPLGASGILGGPVVDTLGVSGSRVVLPRDLARSVMHRRLATATETYRMPPLAKNLVDREAVETLAAWITGLTGLPEVTLAFPEHGGIFPSGSRIILTAHARTTNGSIARVEFYDGDARLGEVSSPPYQLSWRPASGGNHEIRALATDSAGISASTPSTTVSVLDNSSGGLLGEYFNTMNLTGPSLVRLDPQVDFDWGDGSPMAGIDPDTFSVRWSGFLTPAYSELHTFIATVDDGFRLRVGGRLVINQWMDQPPTTHRGTIALTAGQPVAIRMEYYENGGGAVARVRWSSRSQPEEPLSARALRPPLPPSAPPTVILRSPVAGQMLAQDAPVTLVAEALDANGDLDAVEFHVNDLKLGETTDTPFQLEWIPRQPGLHRIRVRVRDHSGQTAETLVEIQVIAPPEVWLEIAAVEGTPAGFLIRAAVPDGLRVRLDAGERPGDWQSVEERTASGGRVEFLRSADRNLMFFRLVTGAGASEP